MRAKSAQSGNFLFLQGGGVSEVEAGANGERMLPLFAA
jgi:hypothetical protein